MNLTVRGVDLIRTADNMVTLNTYFFLTVVAMVIAAFIGIVIVFFIVD